MANQTTLSSYWEPVLIEKEIVTQSSDVRLPVEKIDVSKRGSLQKSIMVALGAILFDLERYRANAEGKPTERMPVQVFELVKDGTFREIFEGLRESPDHLRLKESQIGSFIVDYPELLAVPKDCGCFHKENGKWSMSDRYGTFFLMDYEDKSPIVLATYLRQGPRSSYLWARPYAINDSRIWRAKNGYRLVIPQF